MHSLGFRVTSFALFSILLFVIVIGGISISAVKSEGDRNASLQMNLICDDRAKIINEFLHSAEQSVNMIARFADDGLDSVALARGGVIGATGKEGFVPSPDRTPQAAEELNEYLCGYAEDIHSMFRSLANHSHGLYAYYYRINPQLTTEDVGFLYVKKGLSSFTQVPLTDLSAYSPDDYTHVGWYYTPLDAGRQTWLMPYMNENLDEKMISCAIPVYKSGTFIGVAGMDISFETLVNQVKEIRLFDTGYACLASKDGEILYRPYEDPDGTDDDASPELAPVANYLKTMNSSGESAIPYTYKGVEKEMAFTSLANGMVLVVAAPSEEINAGWQMLVQRIVVIGVLGMVVLGLLMSLIMHRITTPLKRLSDAAYLLANGDYNVEFSYNEPDEVGVLTDAFRKLMDHLKIFISDLNSQVYKDALTSVRNKGAFEMYVQNLNDALHDPDQPNPVFAAVMFDCDSLEEINSQYGRDKGDLYLQTACRLICKTFSHSPVFRVGGDEFVAVLVDVDYNRREDLLAAFDTAVEIINASWTEPWSRVNVAKGVAVFDPAVDTDANLVFTRADSQMQLNKNERKRKQNEK